MTLMTLMMRMKLNVMMRTMITDVWVEMRDVGGGHEQPTDDCLDFRVGYLWHGSMNSWSERHGFRHPGRLVAATHRLVVHRRRLWAGRPTGDGIGQLMTADKRRHGRLHDCLLLYQQRRFLSLDRDTIELVEATFVVVVDEVTARTVRTQPCRVIGLAEVGLVLWMAYDGPQFGASVSKLALVGVLARAVLLVRSAQLGLVAADRTCLDDRQRRCRQRLAGAAVNRSSLSLTDTVDQRRGRPRAVGRRCRCCCDISGVADKEPSEGAAELFRISRQR